MHMLLALLTDAVRIVREWLTLGDFIFGLVFRSVQRLIWPRVLVSVRS